ncbi:response regulator transcription factor [Flavobacterium sp. xlx-214]|uniref:response regulator transcription factor n=1 Tax=unclassified Flavobacterium TaxID=196869 RepID=UPI0013D7DF82|nr:MULTISPECIES: response regulator transcription factor [unclassified Flavobacterium]MBA5793457.1 response regulator transcription factor [Flavobacterium sp. xlx-221]QMI82771.1 response regulator transcription factor [Flavobacterium sp. xlx-214]
MNILLLDDHLMTLDGYALYLQPEMNSFYKVSNCEEFYNWLFTDTLVDIALIDYNLPPYNAASLFNGSDCALLLQQAQPNCKIILVTAHDEAVFLYEMNKKVNPYAIISKIDFNQELINELLNTATKAPYYSPKVKEAFTKITRKNTLLDSNSREILLYLSQGFKSSQLSQFINLSQSGIQKKITKMLQDFNVNDYHELIQILKKDNLL